MRYCSDQSVSFARVPDQGFGRCSIVDWCRPSKRKLIRFPNELSARPPINPAVLHTSPLALLHSKLLSSFLERILHLVDIPAPSPGVLT